LELWRETRVVISPEIGKEFIVTDLLMNCKDVLEEKLAEKEGKRKVGNVNAEFAILSQGKNEAVTSQWKGVHSIPRSQVAQHSRRSSGIHFSGPNSEI
jgi:hypothetical protein